MIKKRNKGMGYGNTTFIPIVVSYGKDGKL
jgi:hypothetical protein